MFDVLMEFTASCYLQVLQLVTELWWPPLTMWPRSSPQTSCRRQNLKRSAAWVFSRLHESKLCFCPWTSAALDPPQTFYSVCCTQTVRCWAAGIKTKPRPQETLRVTLNSLKGSAEEAELGEDLKRLQRGAGAGSRLRASTGHVCLIRGGDAESFHYNSEPEMNKAMFCCCLSATGWVEQEILKSWAAEWKLKQDSDEVLICWQQSHIFLILIWSTTCLLLLLLLLSTYNVCNDNRVALELI